MNTLEASEYTGIPLDILIRMRTRVTSTLRSGPPYERKFVEGKLQYVYRKAPLDRWLKTRRCLLTAGEGAQLLGISRDEILNMVGKVVVPSGGYIYIYPTRNMYVFNQRRAA